MSTDQIDPGTSSLGGWRKSSYSGGGNGDCVEVGDGISAVAVRDSKVPQGSALVFSTAGWGGFVSSLKRGELSD